MLVIARVASGFAEVEFVSYAGMYFCIWVYTAKVDGCMFFFVRIYACVCMASVC